MPVHVRCLIDECANIGQIPNLEKLMATIRSREISACLVLQAQSQLKALYKDNADTIIGNCDSMNFLGGKEKTTLKDLTETLGKETIDMFNTSDTRGSQRTMVSIISDLEKNSCRSKSLPLWTVANVSCSLEVLAPFSARNTTLQSTLNTNTYPTLTRDALDIEKFLSTKLKLKHNDVYEVFDVGVAEDTTEPEPTDGQ